MDPERRTHLGKVPTDHSAMGWAQRANKAKRGLDEVLTTAEDCRILASTTRHALAKLGVEAGGDIKAFIEEAEWLGSFPAGPLEPGGAAEAAKERGMYAFLKMEQLRRISAALVWAATDIKNAARVAKWVTGRIDRIAAQDEQAQDFVFELEIAGRARRNPHVAVSFEEPDIVLGPPGLPAMFSLACKRPRRIDTVGRAILKARDQITRRDLPGVIVIGMEAVFHMSDDPSRPTVFYHAERAEELAAGANDMIERARQAAEPQVEAVFRSSMVCGVLFCGLITGLVKFPSSYCFRWIRRGIANPTNDPRTIDLISELLFECRPV